MTTAVGIWIPDNTQVKDGSTLILMDGPSVPPPYLIR